MSDNLINDLQRFNVSLDPKDRLIRELVNSLAIIARVGDYGSHNIALEAIAIAKAHGFE